MEDIKEELINSEQGRNENPNESVSGSRTDLACPVGFDNIASLPFGSLWMVGLHVRGRSLFHDLLGS